MENEYNYLKPFGTINGTQRPKHSEHSQNFDCTQCCAATALFATGTFGRSR